MAKQGQKLTVELKEQIKAHLAANNNISEASRKFDVSLSTVSKIKNENPDEFEGLRRDKKTQMIEKIWENLQDALELGHQMITEAKAKQREIPLGQISTYYGTLYDKQALMNDEATANSVMTIKMDGDLDKWAK